MNMTEFSNPLEYANDNIRDIFYEKTNRSLLDFVLLCWRSNPQSRPNPTKLLENKFLVFD